jgi:hypothetical protein
MGEKGSNCWSFHYIDGFIRCAAILFALLTITTASPAAHAQPATIGFSIAADSGIDRTAAGLCIDEMAEVVALDGRLDIVPPRDLMDSCVAFDDDPQQWAKCIFGEAPTMSLRVDTRLRSAGYQLDVRYVTASGEVLDHSASVHGELIDLLVRCRHRAVVLIEALYGDIHIRDELLQSPQLLTARTRIERPRERRYVWRRYENDRVGDFVPRRDRFLRSSNPIYTESESSRVGSFYPRTGDARNAGTYFPGSGAGRASGYDWRPRHPRDRSAQYEGYFILEGDGHTYMEMHPREANPHQDSAERPSEDDSYLD